MNIIVKACAAVSQHFDLEYHGISNMESGAKVDLSQLRNLVRSYIDKHLYKTALFWADKAMSLSNDELQDVYWFAQALFFTNQYQRAVFALTSRRLHEKDLACRYLVGKCYAECKKWQDALDVLEVEPKYLKESSLSEHGGGNKKLESALHLLRGLVYEAMENGSMACDCFKEALRNDVHCYEAFHRLTSNYMLSPTDEMKFFKSLPFEDQCLPDELPLVKHLYENKLQNNKKPAEMKLLPPYEAVNSSLDVVVGLAEKHFINCEFQLCHEMTRHVLQQDPFHSACLPLHISCLVELKKSNDLFYLGHKLVDNYPDQAVSWYAVGCYYYLISKYESARRFFSKATTIERGFGPAWTGFGHAFATEGEHDQAIAAYFTASKLMPGAHQPLLYIGMEYTKTNNSKLAERFLNQALSISSNDPFIKHEIGQIAFQNGNYNKAEKYFREALEKVQHSSNNGVLLDTWEPLLNNLGHAVRKLGRYEEALSYHQQALVLIPQNSFTLSAIGFIHSLLGNCEQAISYFHKALSLRKDDTFSVQMLGQTLEQFSIEVILDEPEEEEEDNNGLDAISCIHDCTDTSNVDISMET